MSDIESLLRERLAFLEPLCLEIIDESARHAGHAGAREGGHYRLRIVSPQFKGKTTLERHRIIHEAVRDLMQGKIHALSIRSLTPEEAS